MKRSATLFLLIVTVSCIMLTSCISKPPEPEITYAEFPFKLVYEVNGDRITIEDTYIVEYKGWDSSFDEGTFYLWEQSIKGARPGETVDQYCARVMILNRYPKIQFYLGSSEAYFGLKYDAFESLYDIKPGDIIMNSREYTGPISEEELYEKIGIKIIEKYVSPLLGDPDDVYS